jgi:uncharacterized protein (TIGR02246 family)
LTLAGTEADVASANARFYAAFEKLDLEAMAEVWSERSPVTCIHPGWAPVCGRGSVLASWEGIFKGTDSIAFDLRDAKVFVAGELAWVILVEEITAHQGGSTVTGFALATNTFVREDGRWRMVHHHAAPTQAPPPPSSRRTTVH